MASKPRGKFTPKLGQLVSWRMVYTFGEPIEYYGIITHIYNAGIVQVQFFHKDWMLNVNIKDLKLINDVVDDKV